LASTIQGACILKERIDPPSLLCACLAFIGIMCVVRPAFIFGASDSVAAATGGSWMPVAAAMLAAVSQSLVFVTVRQLKSLHVFVIVHYFLLFVSVVSMLIIVLFERVRTMARRLVALFHD
jgi:drug/metabolite transporter (DMT)-like permease